MSGRDRAQQPTFERVNDGISYRQEYRRCGKKSCSRCGAGGPGHGPYWYAFWSEDGRRHSRYLGKELPPGVDPGEVTAPTGGLRVQTLGGFAVYRGDLPVSFAHRRAAALFKCLLIAPGHRLTRDQAIELLWPESDPERSAANLRTTMYRLRSALNPQDAGTYLRLEGETLELAPSASTDWFDAETFERLASDALARHDPLACRRALDLYTGDYLPDDPYALWTEPTRERLRRMRIDLLLELARLDASWGNPAAAEQSLHTLLAIDAAHEEAAAALMNILAASGRASEALRVYRALAAALEVELDVAPSAEVEAIRARIVAERAAAPRVMPSLPSGTATNLPAQLTSFVGRTWEVEEIGDLLTQSRLVTLTGPGGCGKTRLALEVAATLVDRHRDGVWLVELAGVTDEALVPAVAASALGVEEEPGNPLIDTLCLAWHEHDMLIELDNCEHLVTACAQLVGRLLSTCPRLRVLATSREPLGVPGEVSYRVPSMSAPDPEALHSSEDLMRYEAVELFVARAEAQRTRFTLSPVTAPAVAQICVRLDGLPLAIELAAARLSVLTVESVAQRLDDRFQLLTGGPRTALPRQQTLRATVDWSYSLLDRPERVLLRRLAVFAGGWPLEAAEAVCAGDDLPAREVLDVLDGLVRKSLISLDDRSELQRYRMLETVREYAFERLEESGEASDLLARHASHFVAFAAETEQALVGSQQVVWLERVRADLDNIRAALGWAQRSRNIELGLRIASSIWRFWLMSGQSSEGRRWLDDLLTLDTDGSVSDAAMAAAHYAAGSLAFTLGDASSAQRAYARSLALRRATGDLQGQAEALNGLGVACIDLGEYERAQQWLEESVALRSQIGDVFGRHAPLCNLANIARYRGNFHRARDLYEEALSIQRQFGHTQAVLNTLHNLAALLAEFGDYDHAGVLLEEALAMARVSGMVTQELTMLSTVAAHTLERGNVVEAHARIDECLRLARSLGDKGNEILALVNLGEVALVEGHPRRALELAEEALSISRQTGHRRGEAFSLITLGEAARILEEYDRAENMLTECLALRRELGDAVGTIAGLEATARLAVSRGRPEEAVGSYGTAEALRLFLGTPLPPLWRSEQERTISSLREQLGPERFSQLWEEARERAPSYLPAAVRQALAAQT